MLKDPDWSKSVYLNYFEIHFFHIKTSTKQIFLFFSNKCGENLVKIFCDGRIQF